MTEAKKERTRKIYHCEGFDADGEPIVKSYEVVWTKQYQDDERHIRQAVTYKDEEGQLSTVKLPETGWDLMKRRAIEGRRQAIEELKNGA